MRFSIFSVVLLIFLFFTSASFAVPTANISVPPDGEFCYWFSYKGIDGGEVVTVPRAFKDKSVTVELPLVKDSVPKSTLIVLDQKTGNEAVIRIEAKPKETPKFKLGESDFKWVRRITVNVFSSEKEMPVAFAVLDMKDSKGGTASKLIEPSSMGNVDFFDVASGTVKLSVRYGDGMSASQDFEVGLERADMVPSFRLPVGGSVAVVEKAAGMKPEGDEAVGAETADIYKTVISVLLITAIFYIVYREIKSRGAGAKKVAKGIGIGIPEASEGSAGTPAAEPGMCPFCGGAKDPVTGACACSEPALAAAGTGPRLIASQGPYSGNIYTLDRDELTVGREESCDIAFPLDNTASRNHAKFVGSGGSWKVVDMGSSNGTFVNGMKIQEQDLMPGDEILIGGSRLRFEI